MRDKIASSVGFRGNFELFLKNSEVVLDEEISFEQLKIPNHGELMLRQKNIGGSF